MGLHIARIHGLSTDNCGYNPSYRPYTSIYNNPRVPILYQDTLGSAPMKGKVLPIPVSMHQPSIEPRNRSVACTCLEVHGGSWLPKGDEVSGQKKHGDRFGTLRIGFLEPLPTGLQMAYNWVLSPLLSGMILPSRIHRKGCGSPSKMAPTNSLGSPSSRWTWARYTPWKLTVTMEQ